MKKPLLMDLENNVFLEGDILVVLDRRRLPREIVRLECPDHEAVARAIEDMAVQGAGDIAITAGFGLYLAARSAEKSGASNLGEKLREAAGRLIATRPTGFHLAALVNKLMTRIGESGAEERASEIILASLQKALESQRRISEDTGHHAETLLESGDRVLTHCFAGPALLYMLQLARGKGKDVRLICTETRPYLQGARLTAWSASEMGVDTTLITDNMAAHCMSKGMVSKVFTAADRVAMDGAAANKVGTLQLAICAGHFRVPFYILAYGGPDPRTARGEDIPIEERDPLEVLEFRGVPISGPSVKGFYPAFDITPRHLITGIVTRQGVQLYR